MLNKSQLRQHIRSTRLSLSPSFRQQAARDIADRLLSHPCFTQPQLVGCYCADDNEVETHFILQALLHQYGIVYLPVVKKKQLYFYDYRPKAMVQNQFGIKEPDSTVCCQIPLQDLTVFLMPLVAFDVNCQRLGRGGGFYDRALAPIISGRTRPLLLGLAYECQKVEDCYAEPHDIRLDAVLTEQGWYQSADDQAQ